MIDLKLNKRILLVEVENGTKDFLVDEGDLCFIGNYGGFADIRMLKHLPSGNWEQPIKASEVTEEIAIEIIGEDERVHYGVHPVWQNYAHPEIEDWQEMPNTALWSLQTST